MLIRGPTDGGEFFELFTKCLIQGAAEILDFRIKRGLNDRSLRICRVDPECRFKQNWIKFTSGFKALLQPLKTMPELVNTIQSGATIEIGRSSAI